MGNPLKMDHPPYLHKEESISTVEERTKKILNEVTDFLSGSPPRSIVVIMTDEHPDDPTNNRSHSSTMIHPQHLTGVRNSLIDLFNALKDK